MRLNKPIMTQDGKTLLFYPTTRHRAQERPEQVIHAVLDKVRQRELENHSRIEYCGEPEYWEYKYLTDGRNQTSWEEFYEQRAEWRGYHLISGNFVEISAVFRLLTKDADLLEQFREAFESNAGYAGMVENQKDSSKWAEAMRKRYGAVPPEGEGK